MTEQFSYFPQNHPHRETTPREQMIPATATTKGDLFGFIFLLGRGIYRSPNRILFVTGIYNLMSSSSFQANGRRMLVSIKNIRDQALLIQYELTVVNEKIDLDKFIEVNMGPLKEQKRKEARDFARGIGASTVSESEARELYKQLISEDLQRE